MVTANWFQNILYTNVIPQNKIVVVRIGGMVRAEISLIKRASG